MKLFANDLANLPALMAARLATISPVYLWQIFTQFASGRGHFKMLPYFLIFLLILSQLVNHASDGLSIRQFDDDFTFKSATRYLNNYLKYLHHFNLAQATSQLPDICDISFDFKSASQLLQTQLVYQQY